jgi:hypothetical protein
MKEGMDFLFAKKLPARQLSKTHVDACTEVQLVTDTEISAR